MSESLLDFSKELDVGLLDQVVMTFFTGSGSDQQIAQQILTQFQDHEEAWTRADAILEKSTIPQTKLPSSLLILAQFIALQIMDKFIQTRWNTLQPDGRDAIRNFIVNVIVKVSSDEATLRKEHTYINKLNMVLVQPESLPMTRLIIIQDIEAGLASQMAIFYPRNNYIE
ncbi:hypothetical protein PS6_009626 [Mucor atramentarius]